MHKMMTRGTRTLSCVAALILAGVLVSAPASAEDNQTIPELLLEYQDAASRVNPKKGMPERVTREWITRFEAAIEKSDDPRWRQAGYEVVISLWNWLKEWDQSWDTCQRALQDSSTAADHLT